MLTPKTQYRLANAKEYFEEHLCVGDYYSEGQSIAGQWFEHRSQMSILTTRHPLCERHRRVL